MKQIIGVLLSLTFSLSALARGGTVGNGGFVVTCADSTLYKSLDFVLAKIVFSNRIQTVDVPNLEMSFHRISDLIDKKFPRLSNSFNHYVSQVGNVTDASKTYLWRETDFGGIPETDDQKFDKIPFSCEGIRRSGGWVEQIVVRKQQHRKDGTLQVIFNFDGQILQALAPLQASFVYVHEWLWNYSNDAEQIRKFNYLLHSTFLDAMTPQEATKFLNRIGVQFIN